jgi:predicted MFS family arabinose efflux permease
MPEPAAAPPSAAAGATSGYRAYVLVVLVALYTSNFIDRTILGTLGQPIKEDLRLTDAQLGLLGGLAFGLLYSVLGLPVARLAEKRPRVAVISGALALWSAMTAACALAGNFGQLMAARIGVGIGEAGCIPPANSLLADYFPPEKRATAAGVFSLGIPLGALLGAVLGGLIAQAWGWRAAFALVGLPGLGLAALVKLTLREPVRGGLDPVHHHAHAPPLTAVVRRLAAKPAFGHLAFAAALASFAGYGVSTFAVPFLQRGFGVTLLQASLVFGLVGALSAAVGVAAGGAAADLAGRRDRRWYVLIPAAGFILAAPLYMLAFLQGSLLRVGLFVVAPAVLQYLYLGPLYAVTANMVGPRSRATAAAILTLVINLIGLGLGPTLIGWASDLFAAHAYAGLRPYALACPGGLPPPGASGFAAEGCRTASFLGLQRALVASSAVYLWAGLHLILAARTVRQDLEAWGPPPGP